MEIFKFVFSPIEVNTYILFDETGDCAILDCGCYDREERKEITAYIESAKLNPVLLINTHCHLDHIFGNGYILEKYNLKSIYCEDEEGNRKNAPNHAMLFGLEMESPPTAGKYISDNEHIKFGNTELLALHVPGHTAGSLAFYSEKDRCVFSGDVLFSGSIGRTDLPGGSHETILRSITTKLFTLPPDTIVYPGHGPSTTIEKEMRTNPFFV